MTDIATIWDPVLGVGDWAVSVGRSNVLVDHTGASIVDGLGRPLLAGAQAYESGSGLVADRDLATAVLISVFTDAEAAPDDVIPDGSGNPRGWWAAPIGSKLWLRARSKATPRLPALIESDLANALAWLIEDDVAASVDVSATYAGGSKIEALVEIRRGDGTRIALKFARVWESV